MGRIRPVSYRPLHHVGLCLAVGRMELRIYVRGVRSWRWHLGTPLVQAEKFCGGAPADHTIFLFCDVFGRFHSVQDRLAGEIVRIPTHSNAFFYHPLEAIRGLTLHEGMSMRQLPRWSRSIIIFSETTGLRQDRTSKCS